MKTKRILGVMLALSASATAINSSHAEEKVASTAVEQSVLEPTIAQSYQQLSVDVAQAKFSGTELLSRVDSLVSRIDSTLKLETENTKQLTGLRNATLQMRAKIVRFMKANGTQLVQITGPVVPNVAVPGQPMVDAFGSPIAGGPIGGPVGTGPLGGGITGGGVAGGGVAGGGGFAGGAAGGAGGVAGGLGGLSGLSGLAGVAAATVAATSDDDAGTPASPSN